MRGVEGPVRTPRTVFTFNSAADIAQYATGCDGDIGGQSTVHLDLDERPEVNKSIGKQATGVFWGNMKLTPKQGMEGKIRPGYAGFRNMNRPSLFGNVLEDASAHEYLALRLRLAGDPQTHNSYYVNIQTDGPIQTDLWQHRLFFRKRDNLWEDIFIPFRAFVRTNRGEMAETQLPMSREKIKSVGISMLGGNSNVEGSYELGIDEIRFVNEEDVATADAGVEEGLGLGLGLGFGERNSAITLEDRLTLFALFLGEDEKPRSA
ncbi:complex I intermediate-associated protein 30-domain-containing protein [Panaeolus papilionaceus]|nr:complex I intermediate-associated protein 30-domain-containing protein [Panaeolus papilionaceus]